MPRPVNVLPPVRAILFDAAGTLLHVHPSVGAVYADEARRHGVDVHADAVGRAFAAVWRALRPYADGATPFHTSEAIERAWWRRLVEQVFSETCGGDAFGGGFDAFFDALYVRFERPDAWRLYDDAVPALDALRARGMPLAVVSNWDSRLPRLLDAMGVADRFEFVLTSAEVGVSKPAPAIFQHALDRLELSADEVLHVGDSIADDVRGATQAGLRAVRIDRSAGPDTGVATVSSLLDIVGYLSPRAE